MTNHDIVMTRFSHALNSPIHNRCAELTVLIDRCSSKDLQSLFPSLMDSIFGTSGGVSWGIRNVTPTSNPKDFEILHHFLGPLGPMFRLIYKILTDCQLKYEFSSAFLPSKIQNNFEHSKLPPFYNDIINVNVQSRKIYSLSLNAFDFYMFHFAYHLTNPWQQRNQQSYSISNSVYYVLCCDYMVHFLPTDINVIILPQLTNFTGKNPVVTQSQSVTSRPFRRSNLLRANVLQEAAAEISGLHNSLQQHPRSEIWRSETVVQVFLDVWLNNDQLAGSPDNSFNMHSKVNDLPSGEYIRILRVLVKQFYAFSASVKYDLSPLGELKKIIQPMLQGQMYAFLRHLVYRWPLDGSFRQVLELWLSFIQPWRYTGTIDGSIRNRDTDMDENQPIKSISRSSVGVDLEYREFIAENLIAYTVILQQLIQRFSRTDLTSPKNALMLFRVTKVFSQPNLIPIIKDIEKMVCNYSNSPTHSFGVGYNKNLPPLAPSSYSTNSSNPNALNHSIGSIQNVNMSLTETSANSNMNRSQPGTSDYYFHHSPSLPNRFNESLNVSNFGSRGSPNTSNYNLNSSQNNTSHFSLNTSQISAHNISLNTSTQYMQNLNGSYSLNNSGSTSNTMQRIPEIIDSDMNVRNTKLSAIVRHKMFEWEGSDFFYKPMFYIGYITPEILQLLRCVVSAETAATELIKARKNEMGIKVGFVSFLKSLFVTEDSNDEFSLEERNKVTCYLSFAKQNLIEIYGINNTLITPNMSQMDITENAPPSESPLTGNKSQNEIPNQLPSEKVAENMDAPGENIPSEHEMAPISLSKSQPALDMSPIGSKLRAMTLQYEGDPDLHPIRSYENALLVRLLYKLSTKVNYTFQDRMRNLYNRNDLLGRITHNVLLPPMQVYSYDKSIPGVSVRVPKLLPPRISFRYFANNNILICFFILLLLCYLANYNPLLIIIFLILVWSSAIIIKSFLCIDPHCGIRYDIYNDISF